MYLFVKWKRVDLASLLQKRINLLVRRRYTNRTIQLAELLPSHIDGADPIDYMLDRTFLRPRDIITFFHDCMDHAEGRPRLTGTVIKEAEEEYSRKRLQSLAYEWRVIFPNLKVVANMVYGLRASFPLSDNDKGIP
jgi:hypothetical protein